MSETKFTPGPWRPWKGAPDEPERWLVVAAGAERPYLIATIENGQPGDCLETERHTAHLIAAAPNLYAALYGSALYLQHSSDCARRAVGYACDCGLLAFIDRCGEALKKARGEA